MIINSDEKLSRAEPLIDQTLRHSRLGVLFEHTKAQVRYNGSRGFTLPVHDTDVSRITVWQGGTAARGLPIQLVSISLVF
jgi:hypothetical protein